MNLIRELRWLYPEYFFKMINIVIDGLGGAKSSPVRNLKAILISVCQKHAEAHARWIERAVIVRLRWVLKTHKCFGLTWFWFHRDSPQFYWKPVSFFWMLVAPRGTLWCLFHLFYTYIYKHEVRIIEVIRQFLKLNVLNMNEEQYPWPLEFHAICTSQTNKHSERLMTI